MSVYAGSLVEPTLLQSGIGANADEVLSAVVEVLGDVIDLGRIAAWLMSEVEAVHPYAGVAEYAVELQPQVLSVVFSRHCEGLPVPAYTGFRILISDCLVSMAMAGFRSVWKVHYPVVRQIYDCPSRSVELRGVRALVVDRSRLGQVVEVLRSAAEVLCRGGGVAESELPVFIKQDALALTLGRCCQGNDCEKTEG